MVNTKDLEEIGHGCRGTVYRLSKTRVLKVYHFKKSKICEKFRKNEMEGGKRPGCLRVLRTMKVIHNNKKTIGIVRKYIPGDYNVITRDDLANFKIKYGEYWDDWVFNFRKDSKGKLYMVDTQTGFVDY